VVSIRTVDTYTVCRPCCKKRICCAVSSSVETLQARRLQLFKLTTKTCSIRAYSFYRDERCGNDSGFLQRTLHCCAVLRAAIYCSRKATLSQVRKPRLLPTISEKNLLEKASRSRSDSLNSIISELIDSETFTICLLTTLQLLRSVCKGLSCLPIQLEIHFSFFSIIY